MYIIKTFEDLLKEEAQELIHEVKVDEFSFLTFEGTTHKYESYPNALSDCIKMLKNKYHIKDKTTNKFLLFLKQLFCKHIYVCDYILTPKGYIPEVKHCCVHCLKCGNKKEYEMILPKNNIKECLINE